MSETTFNTISYAGPSEPAPTYNRALHVLALLTTCATFPLIFMGGLVTSHQAGMSVPDWPNSYGYNMFTFPPSKWVGGIFYEHTHRLLGTLVGFFATLLFLVAQGFGHDARFRRRSLVIGLAMLALTVVSAGVPLLRRTHLFELFAFLAVVLIGAALCRRPERRRWVQWLTAAVLVGVIIQGLLGGFRVTLNQLHLAIVHGCFAQAFFCLAAFTSVATSRWWHSAGDPGHAAAGVSAGRTLVRIAVVAVVVIYLQLIVGALMRHFGAGLAIPDLPLAYGHVLPPTGDAGLKLVNDVRRYDLHMPETTLGGVWIHFTHRLGAIVVSAAVLATVVVALRRHRAGACPGIITGLFVASLTALLCLGAAHAIGSTRGVWQGFAFFATAVASGFAARALARRLGPARPLLVPAVLMAALLTVQVTLGVLTVLLRKPADVASAHVGVGALLLMTTFVLTVRAARTYAPHPRTVDRPGQTRESAAGGTDPAGHVATA